MTFIGAGSAVLILDTRHGKPHVWFILTDRDPQGKVLAVMLRSRRRHTDSTTVLAPGEYPFGDRETEGVIDYGETNLFPADKLIKKVKDGRAKLQEMVSAELLARIKNGLRLSGHTPNWVGPYLDSLAR